MENLKETAKQIRIGILHMIGTLGVGHIGGSLSIADLLAVLYFAVMHVDPQNPKWEDRDRLVLSKGHAGPALYAALALRGFYPMELCDTLNQPGTNFPSHCDRLKTPGIDMTTGSLGQGLSQAVGIALGLQLKKSPSNVYVILGDGEQQEGQIWEAAMYAASRKLDHLIGFTDYNHMQLDGMVEDINSLSPLADKWTAFGWQVFEVDGHDCEKIYETIQQAQRVEHKPVMILLHTIKGKGAAFSEGKLASHSMNVTPEMALAAIETLNEEDT
ncbi:transketolase [Oscillibacter sp. PC13]|jgi:transketolase|uniref:transketolase n=1 Tax=Oscillibacter sp. PC13 TaxID=1855299 RepID=UPI0008E06313|nr:transketolase [Oscillibacter sp. PC13]SFP33058.1 transketolase [Oscillibacter sp. PC13]